MTIHDCSECGVQLKKHGKKSCGLITDKASCTYKRYKTIHDMHNRNRDRSTPRDKAAIRKCSLSTCNNLIIPPFTSGGVRKYRCNNCAVKTTKEWTLKNREKKRVNNNKYLAAHPRPGQTAAYKQKNPEKRAAHIAVGIAVRSGKLQKRPCIICGNKKAHGHHDDYSKPLDVIWLCSIHHKERHIMLEARKEKP